MEFAQNIFDIFFSHVFVFKIDCGPHVRLTQLIVPECVQNLDLKAFHYAKFICHWPNQVSAVGAGKVRGRTTNVVTFLLRVSGELSLKDSWVFVSSWLPRTVISAMKNCLGGVREQSLERC